MPLSPLHTALVSDDAETLRIILAKGPKVTRALPLGLHLACAIHAAPRCLEALLESGYSTAGSLDFGTADLDPATCATFESIYHRAGIVVTEGADTLIGKGNFGQLRQRYLEGNRALSLRTLKPAFGMPLLKTALLVGAHVSWDDFDESQDPAHQLLALAYRNKCNKWRETDDRTIRIVTAIEPTLSTGSEMRRIFCAYDAVQHGQPTHKVDSHLAEVLGGATCALDFPTLLLPTLNQGSAWARRLIEAGLSTDIINEQGNTLVDAAIQRGDLDAAKVYRDAGAKLSGSFFGADRGVESHSSNLPRLIPLLSQVASKELQLQALADFPELRNEVARDGSTVLMAALRGDQANVPALLALANDIGAVDRCGWNALHHAVCNSHGGFVMLPTLAHLLANGADLSHSDHMGFTPKALLDRLNAESGHMCGPAYAQEIDQLIAAAERQTRLSSELSKISSSDRHARSSADIL